jgi:hypothetical protein
MIFSSFISFIMNIRFLSAATELKIRNVESLSARHCNRKFDQFFQHAAEFTGGSLFQKKQGVFLALWLQVYINRGLN